MRTKGVFSCALVFLFLAGVAHAALLNESAIGPEAGLNNSDLYESATTAWYQSQYNVTQLITSGSCTSTAPCLWVPWYGSSSSCIATGENESGNLKTGSSCNSSEPINATNNCQVSDEFSQVGLDLSMGQNQTRFQHFHNTVNVINSSRAKIPAWRAYRSGNTIEACRTNINGNCDTASDATARIIIAHWNAANNSFFNNQTQKNNYAGLALNLTIAMAQSELTFSCRNSTIGSGPICWWLRAGNQSSLTLTDGSYTGYYPDAEIAFLQTCSQTGNLTYCAIAGNISLNEKQASKWNGTAFRAPPGRSFKWDNFSSASVPYANCTNTCGDSAVDGDETWDPADAIRAFFEGTANYYDRFVLQANVLANSTLYMSQWVSQKMVQNLNSLPIQYYPNGNDSGSNQSGYLAQAMQAAGIISQNNATQVNTTVWNAMNHYTHSTRKWDSAACPGVYNSAFPIRMLGVGMGRDSASFGTINSPASGFTVNDVLILPSTAYANGTLIGYCNASTAAGEPLNYNYTWFKNGNIITSTGYGRSIGECQQEVANMNSSCGAIDDGSSPDSSSLTVNGTTGYSTTVYAKPPQAVFNGTRWRVRHGSLAEYNITIPYSCWIANTTGLAVRIAATDNSFAASTQPQCLNSTAWENVGTLDSGSDGGHSVGGTATSETVDANYSTYAIYVTLLSRWVNAVLAGTGTWGRVYEEAMIFNISGTTPGVSLNVVNLTGFVKGDQVILSCQATNGTTSATWLNSSTLTIGNIAPSNNWSANNQTFNHNTSVVFGNYCADPDGDPITYLSNNSAFPILANGSINLTSNISRTGANSVNITCSDGTTNTSGITTITVTNTAPNVTSITLAPLPAQAGALLNITYACTDLDNDVCNTTVFYAWFKNGVLNASITGVTFGSGNFTTGDNITGSVRVSDGNLNSTWANTSTATVGDTTVPVASTFSVSPTSVTTSTSTNMSVNCTDNNQMGVAYAEVADTQGGRTNFSMTLSSGNVYAYSYTPPLAGTYAARAFCVDGNGNSANTTSIPFTASQTASGGGGGGGGGASTTTIIQQSNTTYAFASNFVDKGTFLMLSFDEEPYSFSIPVPVSKATKSCSIDLPLHCIVSDDGTQVLITYTEPDHDFLTKTIYGQLRATSTADEVALTQVKVGVVNAGYSVLPFGNIKVTPGPTNKYLIRIIDGEYAGVRLLIIVILGLAIGGIIIIRKLV